MICFRPFIAVVCCCRFELSPCHRINVFDDGARRVLFIYCDVELHVNHIVSLRRNFCCRRDRRGHRKKFTWPRTNGRLFNLSNPLSEAVLWNSRKSYATWNVIDPRSHNVLKKDAREREWEIKNEPPINYHHTHSDCAAAKIPCSTNDLLVKMVWLIVCRTHHGLGHRRSRRRWIAVYRVGIEPKMHNLLCTGFLLMLMNVVCHTTCSSMQLATVRVMFIMWPNSGAHTVLCKFCVRAAKHLPATTRSGRENELVLVSHKIAFHFRATITLREQVSLGTGHSQWEIWERDSQCVCTSIV